MVQLSRRPLSKFIYNSILESLDWLLRHLSKKEEVDTFLHDFLSKTERLMLAKRLAISLMLQKGYSYTEIRATLKVSPSTIYKIQQNLENGKGYSVAIKAFAKREELERFWNGVRDVLHTIAKGKKVFG